MKREQKSVMQAERKQQQKNPKQTNKNQVKAGGEINAGEDMPKFIIGKERRYQEVQLQVEEDVERKQDWLFEPSENAQVVKQPHKRDWEQMTI